MRRLPVLGAVSGTIGSMATFSAIQLLSCSPAKQGLQACVCNYWRHANAINPSMLLQSLSRASNGERSSGGRAGERSQVDAPGA